MPFYIQSSMRFTTKVSSQQTATISKSSASEERFTFTVKKSEVANTEEEGASGGKPVKKSSTLNVNREAIEDFAAVRERIYPVLKARSWVDVTKDLLAKIDPRSKADLKSQWTPDVASREMSIVETFSL